MKILYRKARKRVGQILRELCWYKDIEMLEGHAMADHIHRCIPVPPRYGIVMTIGY
jgi:putative transposase